MGPLKSGEVVIAVQATAINRVDTYDRKTRAGQGWVLGMEAFGVVVASGPDCERSFPPGAHVMALLAGGGYADCVAVDEHMLMAFAGWDGTPRRRGAARDPADRLPNAFLPGPRGRAPGGLRQVAAGARRRQRRRYCAGADGVRSGLHRLRDSGAAGLIKDKRLTAERLGVKDSFDRRSAWEARLITKHGDDDGAVDVVLDSVGGEMREQNARVREAACLCNPSLSRPCFRGGLWWGPRLRFSRRGRR